MLGTRTNLVPWNPLNPLINNHAFSIIKNSCSIQFLTKNNNVLFYLQFYLLRISDRLRYSVFVTQTLLTNKTVKTSLLF